MALAKKFGIVFLVTRICLTSTILVTKASLNPTNVPRLWQSYPLDTTSPKYSHHQYDDRRNLERLAFSKDLQGDYPTVSQSVSISNKRKQKSQTSPQRFSAEKIQQNDVWLSAKAPNTSLAPLPQLSTTTMRTVLSELRSTREYHHQVPQRYATQDVEALDEYLTDELHDDKLPYRGKVETAYYYRRPQDITAVIKALDRFLSRTLNDDGYNSKVHPPLNPVLALILSRYGRYVPGPRNPRVYAYLAANNNHNQQPFGKYKYELDDEPIYTVTR